MSKLKVGTQNASKVYLGGNNILADLTGLNYNVDETLFRNNASGYCFINVSDEDKSIYIYDDSFSETIVIPKKSVKVYDAQNSDGSSSITLKAYVDMTISIFSVGHEGGDFGETICRSNQVISRNQIINAGSYKNCAIYYITA